ncbi:type II toxin-antitoxin system HipA family toxin [Nocardioides hungaricus]
MHVDIGGRAVYAGTAYFTEGRQRVTTSFVYDTAYLARSDGYDLEPSLVRRAGQQYVDGLPGSFSDCAPDRWGRSLIDKRRRAQQRQSDRRLRTATEVDYLVGVSDLTRQGNLRFAVTHDGPFLDPGDAVPKLVSLPKLLASADKAADASIDDLAAVKTLLDAGSGSLGGARPKASVRGDNDALLIAKFPHRNDDWDVMAWEKTALDLAEASGISTPARRLTKVGHRTVLLLDRFDRSAGTRIGYVSAMTMLGARDGDERDYLDIVEAIPDHGARVKYDLEQLFRRVVFGVAVHNTDDHLRNHGFLRAPGGWILSPIFDVNPQPDLGKARVTAIFGTVYPEDEPGALEDLAIECRLHGESMRAIVDEVCAAVGTWREAAGRNGIGSAEQDMFAEMFGTQLSALDPLRK